jgi:hypothetical protein
MAASPPPLSQRVMLGDVAGQAGPGPEALIHILPAESAWPVKHLATLDYSLRFTSSGCVIRRPGRTRTTPSGDAEPRGSRYMYPCQQKPRSHGCAVVGCSATRHCLRRNQRIAGMRATPPAAAHWSRPAIISEPRPANAAPLRPPPKRNKQSLSTTLSTGICVFTRQRGQLICDDRPYILWSLLQTLAHLRLD